MRTTTRAALGLLAVAGLLSAAFTDPAVGEIAADVARDGEIVTFSGHANLADPGRLVVDPRVTGFARQEVAEAAGIDLIGYAIEEYGEGEGLELTWRLSSLPEQVLPELVRYTWVFEVDGQSYQLQAKRSNLASVTTPEAPVDHALEAAEGDGWFQLRGSCVSNYLVQQNPVAGCYHLGFFEGDFDPEAAEVRFRLPYEATDRIGRVVAPTFTRGSRVVAGQSANMSIAAAFQAVAGGTYSSQYLGSAGVGDYYAGTWVGAALGDAGSEPSAFTQLDTPGDGSFSGSLTGAGDTLYVKACRGGVNFWDPGHPDPCTVAAFPVSG